MANPCHGVRRTCLKPATIHAATRPKGVTVPRGGWQIQRARCTSERGDSGAALLLPADATRRSTAAETDVGARRYQRTDVGRCRARRRTTRVPNAEAARSGRRYTRGKRPSADLGADRRARLATSASSRIAGPSAPPSRSSSSSSLQTHDTDPTLASTRPFRAGEFPRAVDKESAFPVQPSGLGGQGGELGARAQSKLSVDVREVKLDRLRREEQGGGRLAVARTTGDDDGDLQLVRCQV